jgi:hypothetical protein
VLNASSKLNLISKGPAGERLSEISDSTFLVFSGIEIVDSMSRTNIFQPSLSSPICPDTELSYVAIVSRANGSILTSVTGLRRYD